MSDTSARMPTDHEPFDLEREPLEKSHPMGNDWGGDGSDRSRPVRAHVLAALRPNTEPYPPPVDALRHLGDRHNADVTQRRGALGLGQEYLPDLLRMARDRGLYTSDADTDVVWAPLHAFEVLSELDVAAVVPELVPLFDLEDDWLSEALPELLGKVGAPALAPIRAYLDDGSRWAFGHSHASAALEKIAQQHPELREQVVAILSDVLRNAERNHEITNTGAMDALVELRAVEALPLIRRAFELGLVDEMMRGPWGDVAVELGVEPEPGDALVAESRRRFEERHERMFPRAQREELRAALARYAGRDPRDMFEAEPASIAQPVARAARQPAQAKARKQKNKRKAEAASRKANRRKHR